MTGRPRRLGAILAVTLAACSGSAAAPAPATAPAPTTAPAPATPAARGVELEVYAAASLRSALAAVEAAYERSNPGTTLVVSTDSSAALATKIEQGAPADVFLSADTANARRLVDGGFAFGEVTTFAGNSLTIVVPADNPAGIETPADLATPGIKIIAAGDEVPITGYAARLVANLAAQPGYPAGFEAAYAANVVSREDNASAVVAKLGLGEGDAGIAYVTDAVAAGAVATVDVPEAANVRATYGGVAVGASPDQAAAAAFLAWLTGPEGQAILDGFGFQPPD